jgi:dolichol-phosphate mannosyltransferase
VQRSLSVLLPVKNAQSTLNSAVHEILDVMTDSGDRFELLIIDDGSTDATSEVAHELTYHYPQVRLVRHGTPRGRDAAIRTGLERSQGEVVMLRDDESGFSVLERPSRAPAAKTFSSRPARPNYLSRIKDFALGE